VIRRLPSPLGSLEQDGQVVLDRRLPDVLGEVVGRRLVSVTSSSSSVPAAAKRGSSMDREDSTSIGLM